MGLGTNVDGIGDTPSNPARRSPAGNSDVCFSGGDPSIGLGPNVGVTGGTLSNPARRSPAGNSDRCS
jgi:hypothetical protein